MISTDMKQEDDAVYLQKDVIMTDDQKINFFDELKARYCKMVQKLENFERKCSYIGKQVSQLEKIKCKTKNKKVFSKRKFSGQNTTSEQFETIENDESIPEGWKSSWRIMEGFSKGQKVKVYWAPNGKFCSSRVAALNYMLSDLKSEEKDVEVMKKSLEAEGWTTHTNLPQGWLLFDDPKKFSKKFVTSDFHYLKNIKFAVKYLSLHSSESEIGNFVAAFALKSEVSISDFEWLHDEAIPYPWRVAQIKNSKGIIIITSSGQVLTSVKSVQEFIEKADEMSKEELKRFSVFLSRQRHSGRMLKNLDDNVKKEATEERAKKTENGERPIKTENLEVVIKVEKDEKEQKHVLPVRNDNDVDSDKIAKEKPKYNSLEWNEEDRTIPAGWKSAISEDGQFVFGQKLKDPSGRMFHGKLDALRNMIKNNNMYSKDDINVMRKGLLHDGWMMKDSLPEGWMIRRVQMSDAKAQRFAYLTPTYEMLYKFERVISFMKENNYSEEEIANFKSKNGLNWHTDEDLPTGWTFAIFTTERQGKLKRFMDPQGKFWNSASQAIKNCFNENPHGETVRQFRKYLLNKDGWFETEYLPTGWIMRQKRSEKGFYFLSNDYEKFNTSKAMYKHLREHKYGENAVKRFEDNYKKLQMPIADIKVKMEDMYTIDQDEVETSTNNVEDLDDMDVDENEEDIAVSLEWKSDKNLPEGWMLSETKISEGELAGTVFKRYRSPCDNYFGNLPDALKFLFNNDDTTDEEMDLMKKGLYLDGWQESSNLPMDWLLRKVKGKDEKYLSPSYEVFTNSKDVLEYLKNNDYTEREIEKFGENPEQNKWSNNKSVPEGWKVCSVGENGSKKFLSPSGSMFENRPEAIKHMLASGKFSNDDITQMQLGITDDGWIYDENLPPGWLKQQSGKTWKFLTSKYEVLDTIAAVLKHLLLNKCSADVVNKFKQSLAPGDQVATTSKRGKEHEENNKANMLSLLPGITVKKMQDSTPTNTTESKPKSQELEKLPNSNKLEWRSDPSLPAGWQEALQKSGGSVFTRFLAPNNKYLGSRLQALQYMSTSGLFSQDDMEKMKKSFEKDGFSHKVNLPVGWMSKGTVYLTHTNEKLASNESVIKFMKENEYDEAEMEKFFEKSAASWNYDDSLPKGWKLSEISYPFDSSKKWFKYMSPEGKVLSSRAQAIKFMTTQGSFNKDDIEKMRSGLQMDGWSTSHNLPPNWFQKRRDQFHMLYLTPECETLKSMKSVISYMKENNYDPAIIKNLKSNGVLGDESPTKRKLESGSNSTPSNKSPRMSAEREENPDDILQLNAFKKSIPFSVNQKEKNLPGWLVGDHTLPEGWKKKLNKEANIILFMSPHGNVFNHRAEAIKFMIEHPEGYSKSDVEEMSSKLVYEDWHTNPLLPAGWRIKRLQGDVLTLTEAGNLFKVVKSARAKIKKQFSETVLKDFSNLMDSLKPSNREVFNTPITTPAIKTEPSSSHAVDEEPKDPLDVSNIETEASNPPMVSKSSLLDYNIKKEKFSVEKEPDTVNTTSNSVKIKQEQPEENQDEDILPNGWKIETDENSDEVFINPAGKRFTSRRDAVEFMIKNGYAPKSIYNLWNSLDIEGWVLQSDQIPAGWRVKYYPALYDYKYLTREMSIIHSTQEASLVVKSCDDHEQERFENWASEVAKSCPKIVWKTDSSLPTNWSISSGLENEIIKDPKGALFEGRKEAIDHMIKCGCTPTDIFKLWNTLHLEGWVTDEENLPTGWKRKYFEDKARHHYLSPMMEVVKSVNSLLKIVKTGKEYTAEEIRRVENWKLKQAQ